MKVIAPTTPTETAARFWIIPQVAALTVVGLLAIVAGLGSKLLWDLLSAGTFELVRCLLTFLYDDVLCEPANRTIGTPAFVVQILAPCSGFEGIGLIVVFLVAYLWTYRSQLRFPHVLCLLPVGIVVIWLTNAVRLAALIVIGSSYSPKLALNGFHSQAGWIAFSAVAVGLVALTQKVAWLQHSEDRKTSPIATDRTSSYLVPFLALLVATMLATLLADPLLAAPVRLVSTLGVLWIFRSVYSTLSWRVSWRSLIIGAGVAGLWVLCTPNEPGPGQELFQRAPRLPGSWAVAWLVCRMTSYVVLVPLVEELAFRGYLIRRWISADFETVQPGAICWTAVAISSVAFGLLHGSNWIPGTIAGIGFALAWLRQGSIGDAVLAHASANGLLAMLALALNRWEWVS